jgi:hypothetical protein
VADGVVECVVEGAGVAVAVAVDAEVVRLPTARAAEKAAEVREGHLRRCALSGIAPTSGSKRYSARSS